MVGKSASTGNNEFLNQVARLGGYFPRFELLLSQAGPLPPGTLFEDASELPEVVREINPDPKWRCGLDLISPTGSAIGSKDGSENRVATPLEDRDRDGWSDLLKFALGTDPLVAAASDVLQARLPEYTFNSTYHRAATQARMTFHPAPWFEKPRDD